MGTNRPFAYNSGSTISGSVKFGNISVGAENIMDYTAQPGGVRWWAGPDEDLGYVIAVPDPTMSQSSSIGVNAGVRFWRSNGKTDAEFLSLSNTVARRLGQAPFSTVADAMTWLVASGLPTTYPRTDYDSDTLTYISGLTTPISFVQKELIDTFVVDLKSGLSITNLSDAFDVLYILAGETAESSLRNLVKRAHDASAVNSPIFKPFEGFTTNGSSSCIDTKYNYVTQGVRYTQDAASGGLYKRNGYGIAGINGAIPSEAALVLQSSGAYLRINGITWWVSSGGSEINGMHILVRDSSTTEKFYQNKTQYSRSGAFSGALLSDNVILGALNQYGTPYSFVAGQYSFFFAGKTFTQTQTNTITDVFEAYMDSLGKGVIS